MTRPPRNRLPLARQRQLIIKELQEELLVYDLERDKAHCLNKSAAAIWRLCDGVTSPAQIAAQLHQQSGSQIDEAFVWLALDQLDRDHLLNERIEWPQSIPRISRREAVKRIGLGAAIALPVVISITAPTPAQAATCRASGQPCTTSVQCCSGFCRGNGTCR
jgi:hypothetical protein